MNINEIFNLKVIIKSKVFSDIQFFKKLKKKVEVKEDIKYEF